jgi:hypothetical protein
MNRLLAGALVAVFASLIGCADKEKKTDSGKPLPSASEMFDKKEVPKNAKGPGAN